MNSIESTSVQPQAADETVSVLATQRTNFQSIIVLALLLIGVGVIYAPKLFGEAAIGVTDADTGIAYVVDLDFWQRTDREKVVRATTRFDLDANLSDLPLNVGAWQGQEKPDSNREVQILLEPEQYLRRLYRDSENGDYMWLSVIGGRSSQPFHAPDICYDADGWQYNVGSRGFALEQGGELHGLYLDAQKPSPEENNKIDRHVVSYFYVFPNRDRSIADGIVLFKLTSNRIGTIEESLDVHENFVQQFFVSSN